MTTSIFNTRRVTGAIVIIIIHFIISQEIIAQTGQDTEISPWLPQKYTSYYWINTEPGGWEANYIYHLYYTPDGKLKAQYQLKPETSDTLFRVLYEYPGSELQVSQTRITSEQYSGNGEWLPVSLQVEKVNLYGDIIESAHYTWSNQTAWVLQNGRTYDYIYGQNQEYIRIKAREYNRETGSYENAEREVYYYGDYGLETWLLQDWNTEIQDWEHKERIDAGFGNNAYPDSLFYRYYQDSIWKISSVKSNILWFEYTDFISGQDYLQYELLFPFQGGLKPYSRYSIEYIENGGTIKTGEEYKNEEWIYLSRLSQRYDAWGNSLDIRTEKWDSGWYTTYWVKTNYTWEDDKLLEQYTEHYDPATESWSRATRKLYAEHSMTFFYDQAEELGLRLFPIPAKDQINLAFSSHTINIAYAEIVSISGKHAGITARGVTPEAEICVEDLEPGMYILLIRCGTPTFRTYRFKFLKL
jgi:hypothetical protein